MQHQADKQFYVMIQQFTNVIASACRSVSEEEPDSMDDQPLVQPPLSTARDVVSSQANSASTTQSQLRLMKYLFFQWLIVLSYCVRVLL